MVNEGGPANWSRPSSALSMPSGSAKGEGLCLRLHPLALEKRPQRTFAFRTCLPGPLSTEVRSPTEDADDGLEPSDEDASTERLASACSVCFLKARSCLSSRSRANSLAVEAESLFSQDSQRRLSCSKRLPTVLSTSSICARNCCRSRSGRQ